MYIFPAIDLYESCAVRLYKGDYNQMTVYDKNPINTARIFESCGATQIHMVDLEGAKDGTTPNMHIVKQIVKETSLSVEVGGGIRSMEAADRYINCGVSRVILGTAAVQDPEFLKKALDRHGDKIAVGVDIKDGFVAVKGWLEKSLLNAFDFCGDLQSMGVKTIICTDISKDGAMRGTNRELYKELSKRYNINIIASGGVSNIDDVIALKNMNLYGAIIGKAYYAGAIDLKEAIGIAHY